MHHGVAHIPGRGGIPPDKTMQTIGLMDCVGLTLLLFISTYVCIRYKAEIGSMAILIMDAFIIFRIPDLYPAVAAHLEFMSHTPTVAGWLMCGLYVTFISTCLIMQIVPCSLLLDRIQAMILKHHHHVICERERRQLAGHPRMTNKKPYLWDNLHDM